MRSFFLLSLLILAACGVKQSTVDYGQTTEAELLAQKGEVLLEHEIPVKEGKVLVFDNDEKYQVEKGIVTNAFKTPDANQRSVIYWKHQFRNCETKLRRINEKPVGHEATEWELACPEEGKSVIYREGADYISRVVEYAKK